MYPLVLGSQLGQLRADAHAARGELGHDLAGNTGDLAAVAVLPGLHHIAQLAHPGLDEPVRHRRQAELPVEQRPAVQRAPLAVGAVAALRPIPERDVHVQLRVAVAGQVVQEQRRGQPVTIPPFPGRRAVVAGAGEHPGRQRDPCTVRIALAALPLQPGDCITCSIHQCTLDRVGACIQCIGTGGAACIARLHRRDPVGGMQHRHALDRRDRQVKIRHAPLRGLGTQPGAELAQLGRGRIRVLAAPGADLPLLGDLITMGLVTAGQDLTVRADVVHEQPVKDLRVHLPGQAQLRRAPPSPLTRRFTGLGVVRHRPGAAASAAVIGEIPDVVAAAQAHHRRHQTFPIEAAGQRFPPGSSGAARTAIIFVMNVSGNGLCTAGR